MDQNIDPNTGLPMQPTTPSQENTIYQPQGYSYPQQPQGYPYQQQPQGYPYQQQPQGYPYQQQPQGYPYQQQPQGYPYPQQQVTPSATAATSASAATSAPAADPAPAPAAADGVVWPNTDKPRFHFGKGALIATIAAAAVVVAGVLFYCLYWNNPHRALMNAAKKTFSDGGYLVDEVGKFKPDKLKNGVDIDLEIDDEISIDMTVARDGKTAQASGKVKEGGESLNFQTEFNDTAIKVNADEFLDGTAVYDYKSDDYGYLDDILGDIDLDQKTLNQAIETVYKMTVKGDVADAAKTGKAVQKRLDQIKIESIDSEKYEVDGKDRNCKGYSMTITGDDMADIFEIAYDSSSESMQKDFGDLWDEVEDYVEEYKDEMIDGLEDMDDVDISYWLYKGEFACVEIEYDGDLLFGVQFLGGDFRLQNIEVYDEDGDAVFIVEGERDGDEDALTFIGVSGDEEEELFTVTFNRKDKTLTLEMEGYDEEYVFEIQASKDSLEIKMDVDVAKGTIKIYNNPKLEKFEEDDPFYINSASEDDLQEWLEDIE